MAWLPAVILGVLVAGIVNSTLINAQSASPGDGWRQWGGPRRDFILTPRALAERWPESGPPVLWSRTLGTGHSAILADGGQLFTMYRVGNGRAKLGPFSAEEIVVSLDAATGRTLWEHKYASRREDFSFGAGPHSTPLVVGDRLFTVGTNQQLFAFEKRSGKVLWSHDLIAEYGSPELLIRPVVKTGYGCSPIAFGDTIICSVGGPGQSVMAFRQADGRVVWKSGDFLTSAAPPILIEFEGEPQVVFLAGGTVTALDPATGRILWSTPHDPGNDLNCATPIWGPDNVLFVSSAYKAGSRAIRLTRRGGVTVPEDLWFTNRVRFMFLNPVRVGDHVYGTTGDFGPAFLTALDIKTGQAAWQHRGFGRASLVQAGDKTIIMDEDGDLALARLTTSGATILAQTKIFDTTAWTVPTLVGTTLYARDREKIVALDLGDPSAPRAVAPSTTPAAGATAASRAPSGTTASTSMPSPAAFGGSWQLDRTASTIVPGADFVGLIGAGAPPMLFVTQPTNGSVLVESPINEGHVRMYRPSQKTETTASQAGVIAMTARWDGARLIADGTATVAAGATSIKEVFSVSPDAKVLSVEITTAAGTSALRYTRISQVGPCESWPTPCKR